VHWVDRPTARDRRANDPLELMLAACLRLFARRAARDAIAGDLAAEVAHA
jgi:hypothetical protein